MRSMIKNKNDKGKKLVRLSFTELFHRQVGQIHNSDHSDTLFHSNR